MPVEEKGTEIWVRVKDPDKFQKDSFRRIPIDAGKGIFAIAGRLKGKTETTIQALRFVKDKGWTISKVKTWVEKHEFEQEYLDGLYEEGKGVAESEFGETFEIKDKEIFAAGTWTDSGGHTDKYTTNDLDEIVENFKKLKGKFDVPLKVDIFKAQKPANQRHGGYPAAGWMSSLKRVKDKLVASFTKVPKMIKGLIDDGAYRKVSSEFLRDTERFGQKCKLLLSGVALLGIERPAVESLEAWTQLYKEYDDNVGGDDIRVYEMRVSGKDDISLSQFEESLAKLSETVLPQRAEERENLIKEAKQAQVKEYQEILAGAGVELPANISAMTREDLKESIAELDVQKGKLNTEMAELEPDTTKKEREKLEIERDTIWKKLDILRRLLDSKMEWESTIKTQEAVYSGEIKNIELQKRIDKLENKGGSIMPEDTVDKKQYEELQKQKADLEQKLRTFTEKETVFSKDLEDTRKQLQEATAKLQEQELKQKEEGIVAWMSERKKEGKIRPADEESIKSLLMKADDEDRGKMKKYFESLPSVVQFEEHARTGKGEGIKKVEFGRTAEEKEMEVDNSDLAEKADKYAEEHKVSYDVALAEVSKEG